MHILQLSCMTRYRVVDILWIFVVFVSWINRQEEHRLSFAQILASMYQSIAENEERLKLLPTW